MSKAATRLVEFLKANERTFTAPYGVLEGDQVDRKGKHYRSVTFGISRILDAEVRVYGDSWMLLRESRHPYDNKVYKDVEVLIHYLSHSYNIF